MAAVVPPLRYGLIVNDLKDRLSSDVVEAILDDNNDGTPDTNPLYRLFADAVSFVEGVAGGHYNLTVLRNVSPTPNEMVRLILDAAEWMAAKRAPEVLRGHDWMKLREINRQDITDWAKGQRRLDTDTTPEPALTQGGKTVSEIGVTPNASPPKVFDDMGDY